MRALHDDSQTGSKILALSSQNAAHDDNDNNSYHKK